MIWENKVYIGYYISNKVLFSVAGYLQPGNKRPTSI